MEIKSCSTYYLRSLNDDLYRRLFIKKALKYLQLVNAKRSSYKILNAAKYTNSNATGVFLSF